MRIAVLHPAPDPLGPFTDHDPTCDPSRHLPAHDWTDVVIEKATAVRQVNDLARDGYDVVVNLCDGAWDEPRAGIEVVQALERVGLPFTGAGSAFYDPSREAMKLAAASAGIAVPTYVMVREEGDVERAIERLRFPLIVKPPHGYSSVGLSPDSRVGDAEALRRETRRQCHERGAALVEEFIEGRELTVLVSEPRDGEHEPWVLPPVEFHFPPGDTFKHFDLKWVRFKELTTTGMDDAELDARVRRSAALAFAAMSGSGYARADLRVDAGGEIHLLEMNPNCGIFYPEGSYGGADIALAGVPEGHRSFLEHLLRCGLRRQARREVPWALQYDRERGFGMVATRDLDERALVVRYEEARTSLVSRQHVERTWHGLKREWFERYAYPLTEHVFQLWSDDPADWRPINHSCDPNTWLDGLDLVARRPIAAGEPLTVDYATFCGPSSASFTCSCGTESCRGVVRGTDSGRPELIGRYCGHVSDFVRSALGESTRLDEDRHEVVATVLGSHLIARRSWSAGELVETVTWGPVCHEPTPTTLALADGTHADPAPAELRYMNHSCEPNVLFDVDIGELRALRDITAGDELTIFYPSTEWAMSRPFDCGCLSPRCIGRVSGAADLPGEVLADRPLSSLVRRRLTERGTGPRRR